MSTISEIFSKRLRIALEDQGFSIRGFAKHIKMSPTTVQKWVQNQPPPVSTIDELASTLDVSPQWLLGAEDNSLETIRSEAVKAVYRFRSSECLSHLLTYAKELEEYEETELMTRPDEGRQHFDAITSIDSETSLLDAVFVSITQSQMAANKLAHKEKVLKIISAITEDSADYDLLEDMIRRFYLPAIERNKEESQGKKEA